MRRRLSRRLLLITAIVLGLGFFFIVHFPEKWKYTVETSSKAYRQCNGLLRHLCLLRLEQMSIGNSKLDTNQGLKIRAHFNNDEIVRESTGNTIQTTSKATTTTTVPKTTKTIVIKKLTTTLRMDRSATNETIVEYYDENENETEIDEVSQTAPSKIPQRIHQMYKNNLIPNAYTAKIKSWIHNQPNWEYWFWTDEDIRNLILDYHPDFLPVYDNYKYGLQRADSGRYIILYHFGGLYVDQDYESLKPIDDYLINRTMILAPEPREQSLLLYNRPIIVTNSIMAAAPEHEFLSCVIAALPAASKKQYAGSNPTILETTGPNFLQTVYEKYVKNNNKTCNETCQVYLAPYEILVPTTDAAQKGNFRAICTKKRYRLNEKQRGACDKLRKSNYIIADTSRAYAKHHWQHWGYENMDKQRKKLKHNKIEIILKDVTVHRYVKEVSTKSTQS